LADFALKIHTSEGRGSSKKQNYFEQKRSFWVIYLGNNNIFHSTYFDHIHTGIMDGIYERIKIIKG
jgi:hypothetical protein